MLTKNFNDPCRQVWLLAHKKGIEAASSAPSSVEFNSYVVKICNPLGKFGKFIRNYDHRITKPWTGGLTLSINEYNFRPMKQLAYAQAFCLVLKAAKINCYYDRS